MKDRYSVCKYGQWFRWLEVDADQNNGDPDIGWTDTPERAWCGTLEQATGIMRLVGETGVTIHSKGERQ